ncbi:unnamed protein product [Toxocara canis]|uniref:Putative serine/threonine-protein kinase n=1 Tax=Toxocara canis TaxID=6265 RepID=A0A183UYB2_TOXCA|nr:unnamed protein product [Toxocara canis]
MTLVGISLPDLKKKHGFSEKIQKLAVGCYLSFAIKALNAIRELYEAGCLDRDINEGNFAITLADMRRISVLDFSMCRRCKDKEGIRLPRRSVAFRGSVGYAPLSYHTSREHYRKDDLECCIY